MIIRISLAIGLALLILGLGITVDFSPPAPDIKVAVFFEVTGEIPGVEFRPGGRRAWSPFLLCVGDADPGLIDGPYPGLVLPFKIPPVEPEFLRDKAELFANLVPGSTLINGDREGVGRLYVGDAELFWIAFLAVGRGADGNIGEHLVICLAVYDMEQRFPRYYLKERAIAFPFKRPKGAPQVLANFRQRAIHFEGPLERPTRLTHRIMIELSFEDAATDAEARDLEFPSPPDRPRD